MSQTKIGRESHPMEELQGRADDWHLDITSVDFAKRMDDCDPLKGFREKYFYPKCKGLSKVDVDLVDGEEDCTYLCGNSLGLQAKATRHCIIQQLDKWAQMGVYGHFEGPLPWALCDEEIRVEMADIVGGKPLEVNLMNSLSVNIHLMMISFYRPTAQRHKIILESHAFPSDHYVVESQMKFHGFDPKTSMICIEPREGEATIQLEDFLAVIEKEGDSTALVLCPGLQYYTGQLFDIEAITKAGHEKGCYVAVDLAHAVGNVELQLHDWDVDFACWCTYKYLSSGAGGIGGVFLHEKHDNNSFPRLQGWWSHKMDTRFQMNNVMDSCSGVDGYRITNPSMLQAAALKGSLQEYKAAGMSNIRQKSLLLTAYLEHLLLYHYPEPKITNENNTPASNGLDPVVSTKPFVRIVTPSDPAQRGAQLSVMFSVPIVKVFEELEKRGVVLDKREPNVLRVAPAPMYNSFNDVHKFIRLLGVALDVAAKQVSSSEANGIANGITPVH